MVAAVEHGIMETVKTEIRTSGSGTSTSTVYALVVFGAGGAVPVRVVAAFFSPVDGDAFAASEGLDAYMVVPMGFPVRLTVPAAGLPLL
jgi:hypothetical protein